MSKAIRRITVTLDEETKQRLERLASKWNVSKSEVVRRSVKRAEKGNATSRPDPIAMLRRLHDTGGGITPTRANKWIAEIREDRKRSRGK